MISYISVLFFAFLEKTLDKSTEKCSEALCIYYILGGFAYAIFGKGKKPTMEFN